MSLLATVHDRHTEEMTETTADVAAEAEVAEAEAVEAEAGATVDQAARTEATTTMIEMTTALHQLGLVALPMPELQPDLAPRPTALRKKRRLMWS